jgi:CheY-like chemotaxis protein
MMPGSSNNCVLLVDDEPAMRDLLTAELEEAGFEAQETQDGIDAMVTLRKAIPDAIISDVQMPRMPGIESTSVVRHLHPLRGSGTIFS